MTRDDELLDAPLSVLRLSIRALNSLRNNAIHSVRDLAAKTEAELLELPQLGGKSLEEIKARLRERGLILGQDPGPQRVEQTPSVPERLARIEAQLEALTALVMTLVRKEKSGSMTARPIPKRHWRSYGDDPLPSGAGPSSLP